MLKVSQKVEYGMRAMIELAMRRDRDGEALVPARAIAESQQIPLRFLEQQLGALHKAGLNDFNIHRADDLSDAIRYPVFVRKAQSHTAPVTGLLKDRHELEREIENAVNAGTPRELLVVTAPVDELDWAADTAPDPEEEQLRNADRDMVRRGLEALPADYREVLERPDIDAVVVCLPNALHADAGIAALQGGKHLYLEKPLALNLAEMPMRHA